MDKEKRREQKKVWIVGAGPGDPELLSRRALRCIREADTILYDRLIHPSVLNEAKIDAELIYAGKESGSHGMSQEKIHAVLIEKAKQGRSVLRLKGGDPYIFGRGAEEARALLREGIPFEVVNGISAAIAAPSLVGIPLTHRDLASSCHIIAGHRAEEREIDFKALAKLEGTLVFLMGLQNLGYIAKKLRVCGMRSDKPVGIVCGAFGPRMKTCMGTLENIEAEAKNAGLVSPAVIVVGDTVRCGLSPREEGGGSLYGKHVLLTGSRRMVARLRPLLEERFASISAISLIEAIPISREECREKIEKIGEYAWIVFTSSNGIAAFFGAPGELHEDIDFRRFAHIKFAVIGEGTAKTLRKYGFRADFIPSVYSVKALAQELSGRVKEGERVLILRAAEGSEEMNRIFDREKIAYSDSKIYRTGIDYRRKQELERVLPSCDYVFLCSRMGAKAFLEMAGSRKDAKRKLVSIGPYTTAQCREYHVDPLITAKRHSAEGMITALEETLREGGEGW